MSKIIDKAYDENEISKDARDLYHLYLDVFAGEAGE